MNAYRYVRYNTQGYSKPYVLRNGRIAEIMARYKTKSAYEDLVQSIVQKPGPPDSILSLPSISSLSYPALLFGKVIP